ncbi:MAG TPA: signal peptidase I [Candidatus Acidoferrum sp.]|nr:signal peptidase I [Candidatus Acidoferrum sp.]
MTEPDLINVSNTSKCDLVSKAVRKAGRVRLRVSGTSMVPAIRPGDLITVESALLPEIAPGEVIVFIRSGRLVAHRVNEIVRCAARIRNGNSAQSLHQSEVITRGDRARRNDSPVSSSELIGRVTQIERGGRRVRLRDKLTAADQVVSRLLRISDRATVLYLRLSAL